MTSLPLPDERGPQSEQLRAWLDRLNDLVNEIDACAKEREWCSRRTEVTLPDKDVGAHHAPALLLQHGSIKIPAEPITRCAIGADGVVDFYVMPAHIDIARLFFANNRWNLEHAAPDRVSVVIPPTRCCRRILGQFIDRMVTNEAASR